MTEFDMVSSIDLKVASGEWHHGRKKDCTASEGDGLDTKGPGRRDQVKQGVHRGY